MEDLNELFKSVEQWGIDRKIVQNSSLRDQFLKLVSEVGELGDAIAKGIDEDIEDAIGDSMVVLILMARIHSRDNWKKADAHKCLAGAYEEIRHRTGHLNSYGIFVKDDPK